jgi:hypothetical protein
MQAGGQGDRAVHRFASFFEDLFVFTFRRDMPQT